MLNGAIIILNVCIIYDSESPEKRRTCFWESIKEQISDNYNFQFISIQDTLVSDNPFQLLRLFDKNKTDIIILNWDSINGDPIYGSDKTYQFFNHYKSDLLRWVKDGGIIVLEAQTVAWKLLQESYGIFTENTLIRTTKKKIRGKHANVNKKLRNKHPILKGLSEKIELPEALPRRNWFPLNNEVVSIDEERLYQGWFEKYPRGWEPLIFSENSKKKPIMLCRILEKKGSTNVGGYIITTMYIGALGSDQLVNNILNFPNNLKTYYIEKENDKKIRRGMYQKAISILISLFILLLFLYQFLTQNFSDEFNFIEYIKSNFLSFIAASMSIILVLFGPAILIRFLSFWTRKKD